ncbi:TadE/TadG family type IV pilus assembly protein [Paenibacillus sp. GCM10023252]|uniref:TadE/TadG family type IV pilus assembly protein n=1 Tax=Paenibacillus sp. GCM10023252 TaxID=3252649 RepID=UPI00361A2452
MTKRTRSFHKGEEGSFTLEASAVFPLLFGVILLLMLLGMYLYQNNLLYYSASATAERTAFRWDNSKRDVRSGIAPEGEYDGLYWRLGDDAMLKSVFGLGSGDGNGVVVEVPAVSQSSDNNLPQLKILQNTAPLTTTTFQGEAAYRRAVTARSIAVKLRAPMSIAALERSMGRSEPQAMAAARIVEPAEFIRTVDLARYYTAKFGSATSAGGAAKRSQAGEIMNGKGAK